MFSRNKEHKFVTSEPIKIPGTDVLETKKDEIQLNNERYSEFLKEERRKLKYRITGKEELTNLEFFLQKDNQTKQEKLSDGSSNLVVPVATEESFVTEDGFDKRWDKVIQKAEVQKCLNSETNKTVRSHSASQVSISSSDLSKNGYNK